MNTYCFAILPTAVGGIAVLALSACGGAPAPAATVTQVAPTVPLAPATVTATPSPTPPPTETPTAEAVVTTPEPAPVETFTMPKLVGVNLQLAQDMLQKKGSFLLDQEDALGLDRIQVLDSNWQVCKQSPKAGKKVAVDAMITLSSVKLSEDCP